MKLFVISLSCFVWFAESADDRFTSKTTPYGPAYIDWKELAKNASLSDKCRLVNVQALFRHGSRSYGSNEVKSMQNIVNKLRNYTESLTELGLIVFNWTSRIPSDEGLFDVGKSELNRLARSYFDLFHGSEVNAEFQSTSIVRTQLSGRAFMNEWFMLANKTDSNVTISLNDTTLLPMLNCPRFIQDVYTNPQLVQRQAKIAQVTETGRNLLKNVNSKLVKNGSQPLNFDDMLTLFSVMSFEDLGLNDSSALKPIFSDQKDRAFLEYILDLNVYYGFAYGSKNNIAALQSCSGTNEIFYRAEVSLHSSKSSIDAVFKFTHAETLTSYYALFDMFDDGEDAMVGNAPNTFYMHRKFDVSEIARMAANLAFLFYKCGNERDINDALVMAVVNGKAQEFTKACPNAKICPLKQVKAAYPLATGFPSLCKRKELCALENSNTTVAVNESNPATTTTFRGLQQNLIGTTMKNGATKVTTTFAKVLAIFWIWTTMLAK